jgi:hypothetical protein
MIPVPKLLCLFDSPKNSFWAIAICRFDQHLSVYLPQIVVLPRNFPYNHPVPGSYVEIFRNNNLLCSKNMDLGIISIVSNSLNPYDPPTEFNGSKK